MPRLVDRFTSWVFRFRTPLALLFLLATGMAAYFAARVRVDASFNKTLPSSHPYIQTFTKYQSEFGGANRVLIALMARDGDIFNETFFKTLKETTDEVFFLPGVDRSQVQSLFTPNVRYVEVVEDGFAGGPVIPAGFALDAAGFATVRDNILKSGKLGQLVANDFGGALISAQLIETDPASGAKLDYAKVASRLEEIRREVETKTAGAVRVHIIGYAKAVGDISDGTKNVLIFFGISILITFALVWSYAGRWKLALSPVICSLVAVVWQLGILTALGYGIDPLSILVPFLVFAIGVSHGVQMVRAFRSEVFKGRSGMDASREAFRQLLIPGGVALLADTVGFITMLEIDIRAIRELAISASLGVGIVIVTNLFLLPIILSYLRLPPSYAAWVAKRREGPNAIWGRIAREMKPGPSLVIVFGCLALGFWGWSKAKEVRIGDQHAGTPELRADSRYNRDTAVITSRFSIGVDILSVIVEATPNACVDPQVVTLMDQFEGTVRALPGVQSVISLSSVAKIVNSGWNEGSLKWRVIPANQQALAQAVSPVDTATGLINPDGSVMPILIFLKDHKAETLNSVTDTVKSFAAANNRENLKFSLASGNAGVMAATNEVVAAAQDPILLWVFGSVTALCLLTFRSIRATLCIIVPLAIVSYLSYALMVYLKIGLKSSTLPVVALGVGIGVDYGIYIFASLRNSLDAGDYFEDAMFNAFKETGSAVLFTGLTLAIGVGMWLFSEIKFQADMGVLLMFMFVVNMLGALFLLPAMARWLYHHHTAAKRK